MAYQIGSIVNANSSPAGRGIDMPYIIVDILKTYNCKNELTKIIYVCEIDLGEGLKGASEFTEDQINAFKRRK